MVNVFKELELMELRLNGAKNKVEQKQSRAIKQKLVNDFAESVGADVVVNLDVNDKPVIVLDNGLIIGFDFVVKKLDTELYELEDTEDETVNQENAE